MTDTVAVDPQCSAVDRRRCEAIIQRLRKSSYALAVIKLYGASPGLGTKEEIDRLAAQHFTKALVHKAKRLVGHLAAEQADIVATDVRNILAGTTSDENTEQSMQRYQWVIGRSFSIDWFLSTLCKTIRPDLATEWNRILARTCQLRELAETGLRQCEEEYLER